jgi:hypothetical protein
MKPKKIGEERTWAKPSWRIPSYQPTGSPTQILLRRGRPSSSSSCQAAGWSPGRHTIHRRLPDVHDEDRRPLSTIRGVPLLWIRSRNPSSSSPRFFSSPTETLALADLRRRRLRSPEASPSSPGAPLRRLGSPGGLNRGGKVSISGFLPFPFAANSPESARLRSPPAAIHSGDHLGSTQVRI